MDKRKAFLLFLLPPVCLFALGGKESGELKPEDFAALMSVSGAEDRLLSLEIPDAVYRGLKRPDRGDMRVFDSDGLPVPFTVRALSGGVFTPPPEEAPFFVWEQERDALPVAGTDIVIESGAVVRIINRNPPPSSAAAPAYLLDFSGFAYSPVSLSVLVANEEYYNSAVRLYSSTDLAGWTEFDRRQVLAYYGDSGLNRGDLELPAGVPYLLVKFDKGDVRPLSFTVSFAETAAPPPGREGSVPGRFRDSDRRTVEYDLEGFFPLLSVNFILPGADAVEASVLYRFSPEEDWRFLRGISLFRFRGSEGDIFNEAVEVSFSAPFWKLSSLSLPFAAVPGCSFSRGIEELIFVGRGKGPWTLAFGNAAAGPGGGLVLPGTGDEPVVERAAAGSVVFTGKKSLSPGRLSQALLWSVLAAAAVLLTLLAVHITRIMKKEDQK